MKLEVCYPNFTKKAVSFTIDDGNLAMDEKFLSIVGRGGIRGTFNLCPNRMTALSPSEYREFYKGHEIANHMSYHPMALDPAREYVVTDMPFDPATADEGKLYRTEREGLYHMHAHRWLYAADRETYLAIAEESRLALDEVFGEGSTRSFVYPYGWQKDGEIYRRLAESGRYYGIRRTGAMRDTVGFRIPATLPEWSYTADVSCLLPVAEAYERHSGEGELKYFCFGVHSVDFETAGAWGDLETFVARIGNREEQYYYATVGEIFAYARAASAIKVNGDRISNPGDMPIALLIDGEKVVLPPDKP